MIGQIGDVRLFGASLNALGLCGCGVRLWLGRVVRFDRLIEQDRQGFGGRLGECLSRRCGRRLGGCGSGQHGRHLRRRSGGISLGGLSQRIAGVACGMALRDGLGPCTELFERLIGECEQAGRGAVFVRDLPVEHLFERPGSLAVVAQADHARTALEGVEGAAQAGERAFVFEVGMQLLHQIVAVADDFPGFFQEDLDQLLLGIVFGRSGGWRGDFDLACRQRLGHRFDRHRRLGFGFERGRD